MQTGHGERQHATFGRVDQEPAYGGVIAEERRARSRRSGRPARAF